MRTNMFRTLALVALLIAFAAVAAGAVEVTFRVRMSYQVELGLFDPGEDFVDIAGTFNNWGEDLTPLSDADGDTIYEVTIDGFDPDEYIEYKYRLNGEWGGTEEFPGVGNNRTYTVPSSDDSVLVWYNDQEPGSAEPDTTLLEWWNDCVFYEVFVRSFYDSDGDGIGDFQGLTSKLDYLNDGDPATSDDLGITGIWLMPIHDSPTYHGYDALDYRSINPDYGTMADFETFLQAAHDRGIKVIIDYVMNHCSNQHPWFEASANEDPEFRDFFRWSPTDPGQTGPWGQQVWHWDDNEWYYGLFWSGMPDLNYETPAVRDTMFQIASYWLDEVGVDGFRLDAILYIHEEGDQLQNTPGTFAFWEDYNTYVKSVKPDMLSVGEAWTGTSTILNYVDEGRLDICFEFNLAGSMLGAVNSADAGGLSGFAAWVYQSYPYLQYATFLTNHDQDRVFTVLGEDIGKAKAAAGLYLTLPGVPFLYYGEEIGMTGSGDHLNIRTPMQWTDGEDAGFTTGTPWRDVNWNYVDRNVAEEASDPNSLLEWYKKLIHVRNDSPALRRGLHDALGSSAPQVLAFIRTHEEQMLLCMTNSSPSSVSDITLSGAADSLEPGEYTLVNLLDPADTLEITVSSTHEIIGLELGPYQTAVYEFFPGSGVDPGDGDGADSRVRLGRSYPNPFKPSTTIGYSLPAASHVRMSVYDVAGREVAVLVDDVRPGGPHEVTWNGTGSDGTKIGSGVYFVRLDVAGETRTSRLTLLR